MSLIEEFTSLTETKILLVEVSKAKRKVLLKKIVDLLSQKLSMKMLGDKTKDYIDNHPIVVERTYGEFFKKMSGTYDITSLKEFYLDRFDREEVKDQTINVSYKQWYPLIILIMTIKLFKKLEKADPTGNMKYGNWLVDILLKYCLEKNWIEFRANDLKHNLYKLREERGRFFEDLPKLEVYLEAYNEMKQKNKLPEEYKDINKVVDNFIEKYGGDVTSPLHILGHITDDYRTVDSGEFFKIVDQELQEDEDYIKLVEGEEFIMYEPVTQKGTSILGMNTEWCTTYGTHCLNPDYQNRSPATYDNLFILVNKNDPEEKYQFHFGTGQYMDKNDNKIDIKEFLEENPKIGSHLLKYHYDILLQSDKDNLVIAKLFKHNQGTLAYYLKEDPEKVVDHAWKAFLYAEDKLIDTVFNLKESTIQKHFTASRPLFYLLRWNTNTVGFFVIGDEDVEELDRRARANLGGYLFEWNGSLIRMENSWEENFYKGSNKKQELQYLAEFFESLPKEGKGEVHMTDNIKQFVNNESN